MALDTTKQRLQRRTSRADLIGERRQDERHALAGIALGLTVQRLVLTELLEQQHGHEVRPGPAARRDMEGGRSGSLMLSQSRHVIFLRTCWITFHWRGITSSVSVTVSPSLRRRVPPQQSQVVGAGTTTRSRGRCAGNGWRDGRLRANGAALVDLAAARSAAISSSVAPAS